MWLLLLGVLVWCVLSVLVGFVLGPAIALGNPDDHDVRRTQ